MVFSLATLSDLICIFKLVKLQDPLDTHNNKEEEETQGESTHPYLNYPVSQAALEGHHKILNECTIHKSKDSSHKWKQICNYSCDPEIKYHYSNSALLDLPTYYLHGFLLQF